VSGPATTSSGACEQRDDRLDQQVGLDSGVEPSPGEIVGERRRDRERTDGTGEEERSREPSPGGARKGRDRCRHAGQRRWLLVGRAPAAEHVRDVESAQQQAFKQRQAASRGERERAEAGAAATRLGLVTP
jgi:hypothetical protein